MTRSLRARPGPAWAMGLVALAAALGGCVPLGFVSYAVLPDKVPAKHRLADRPTLVLVEDPNRVMDANVVQMIAGAVSYELTQNKVVTQVIPMQKLDPLVVTLGQEYPRTPLDRLGREVGA